MDVKQSKPSLEIEPALVDGFLVREVYDGTGDSPGVLFAGTLSHCLAFMESRMRPQQAIYTPDPAEGVTGAGKVHHSTDIDWSGVKAPDCTEAELEAARREINQPGGVVRATPVDLRDISAPGYSVADEWDAGVKAAEANRQDIYKRNRRGTWFADGSFQPAPADVATRATAIHKLQRAITIPHRLADITGPEALILLAALRQQDAQNAGRIEKDFK